MPRPLKNNEISDKLSTLSTELQIVKNELEKQRKLNYIIGVLLICLGGLLVY